MTDGGRVHRRAPHPEWVEMYRHGIGTDRIAKLAGVAASTVRYHLRMAVLTEPGLPAVHSAAIRPQPRKNKAGLSNLADLIALYERERRLPSTKSTDLRERALAVWLMRRRKDWDDGTLNPFYSRALEAVPGWEQRTRKAKDEDRWEGRLAGLAAYLAAGHNWPRRKNTDTEEEQTLGVWLQSQRAKLAAGRLPPRYEARLDEAVHGWRKGRKETPPRRT